MRLFRYTQVASTNDQARALAAGGEPLPFVVQALLQTAGRGRQGRSWSSPPGVLTATWAVPAGPPAPDADLATDAPPLQVPTASALVPLLAGLAVRDALRPLAGERPVLIKWPNDVWLDGRKVAGILCERLATPAGPAVLIGIGLNVCCDVSLLPAEVQARATAVRAPLADADARSAVLDEVREAVTAALVRRLAGGFGPAAGDPLTELRAADALAGRWVRVTLVADGVPVEGRAVGIGDDGSLLLALADGPLRRIDAGTVEVLGAK